MQKLINSYQMIVLSSRPIVACVQLIGKRMLSHHNGLGNLYNCCTCLDSSMAYIDSDTGAKSEASQHRPPAVFLHGNPTSSYLWRNIIPIVSKHTRCLAPDLMGMGKSGLIPANSYRFVNHAKYLDSWFEQILGSQKITLVCHDWGSALAFYWAHRHPNMVHSIVHMEGLVSPFKWKYFPEVARDIFKAMRSPAGEELVLKKNIFVERLLPLSIMRKLTEEEMSIYRKPFLQEGESRRPMLTWPREIPTFDDGPQDVVEIALGYSKWLEECSIPKLYLHGEPGFFSPLIKQKTQNWKNQKVVTVKGLHFLQEDSPTEIGEAIVEYLQELELEIPSKL